MMAGNPSWWSMVEPQKQPCTAWLTPSASCPPLNSMSENHEPLHSWNQLLFRDMYGVKDKYNPSHIQSKKLEIWAEQIYDPCLRALAATDGKQVISSKGNILYHVDEENLSLPTASWSQTMSITSSRPCLMSSVSNMLDFSHACESDGKTLYADRSSEPNSTVSAGCSKKMKLQSSSAQQPPLKVRKEKLGDRITVLHQLVSPFGKTDTASVLLEAIGHIRFLQGQIEAFSIPYLGISPSTGSDQQQSVPAGNCLYPEDQDQLLNDICLQSKAANCQDTQDKPKDLKSRGLCLVPVACTQQIGEDTNGADYWSSSICGGFC